MNTPLTLIAGVWNALKARTQNYETRFSYFGRNNAGVPVSHDSAMQVAAVWACIDVIASALASTDWNVYGGTRGADKKSALPDDGLQYTLNARFNREMTAQSGKRAMLISAVGFGNGVAEIEKDLAGRITALWPLDPARVEVRRDQDTLELFYRCFQARSGGFVDLNPADVFHIRGAGLTGFAGDDPVGRAIQSIANAVAIDQFGASYFANGTQLGVVLEHPGLGKMDDATYNRLKESWEERHVGYDAETGRRKSFRIGFLSGGMKLHQLNIDAEKAQMVEAKQLSVEEICRWFRVPPHKIAHLLRATNNNIEHQGLEFSRDTIRPWKIEIEQECDWSLIPLRGPKKFVELDVDWMEQGDYGARATAYSVYRGCGVMSVNDVLRKLGENTIGPEGDKRTMNGASVLLEDVGKNMLPAPAPGAPVPAPAEPDAGAGEPTRSANVAVLEAWATSVYARIASMVQNRTQQNAGRADGKRRAQMDGFAYMASALDELLPSLLAQWPNAGAAAEIRAVQVIRGRAPEEAAAELIGVLERAGAPERSLPEVAALSRQMEQLTATINGKKTTIDVHNNLTMPDVRVAGATVNVPERELAVNVAGATTNVAAPVVNMTMPEREVRINVEQPRIDIAGAVVNVPEQPAPVVNVAAPVINMAPADVVVNVQQPDAPIVNVAAPAVTVNVPKQAAPVVNVAAAKVTVPRQAAPVVNVSTPSEIDIRSMPARRTDTTVERNADGSLRGSTATEADE